MILILSRDNFELSTEEVIDWLNHFAANYFRLNGEDIDGDIDYVLSLTNQTYSFALDAPDITFTNNQVNVVWYRRWSLLSKLNYIKKIDNNFLSSKIYHHLNKEFFATSYSLFSFLEAAHWLDNPNKTKVNKLAVLKTASRLGLKIPETIITTSKRVAYEFIKQRKEVISKGVSEGISYVVNEETYILYTSKVDLEKIEKFNRDYFYPTLFQELLQKEYELRIFFLNNNFYSMAIFSQNNVKTSIDFRKYDHELPNRRVPYLLPENIKAKLILLMNDLELTSGSIDMIVTADKEYIFLEVNPIGQFGMVSKPCNYYLEKIIAEYLIEKDEKR